MVTFGVNAIELASIKDYKGKASFTKSKLKSALDQNLMSLYTAQLEHVTKAMEYPISFY